MDQLVPVHSMDLDPVAAERKDRQESVAAQHRDQQESESAHMGPEPVEYKPAVVYMAAVEHMKPDNHQRYSLHFHNHLRS